MYFRLKDNYILCGWNKLPCAVSDTEKRITGFMDRQQFAALRMCNGAIDLDGIAVTDQQRDYIKRFVQAGIVEPLEFPAKIANPLSYRKYPSRYIHAAQWSITGNCNYRCRHCYMSAPRAMYGELTPEQCMRIVDQLAECGIMNVSLTGGEPLVRKDFMKIAKRLAEKNIRITTIYTNGRLVTGELLEQLDRHGMHPEFNMSFDGVGMHDWIRGIDGAEEHVLDAFRLCREFGFPTGAEYCLHKGNRNLLRESVRLLSSLGVSSLKVSPVAPIGEGLVNQSELILSDEEVFDTYLQYIPHFYEDGMPLRIMLGGFFASNGSGPDYRIPAIKFAQGRPVDNKCICGHARSVMYIAADGKLLPCMPLSGLKIREEFPNVLDMDLKDALTDSFYMSVIDTRLRDYLSHNPDCSVCEYKNQCAGGCRGNALCAEDGGDYLAADRTVCAVFKKGYVERIHKTAGEAIAKHWISKPQ
jgi:radical SAM protein with 4Fe4S-binding SPASM domain